MTHRQVLVQGHTVARVQDLVHKYFGRVVLWGAGLTEKVEAMAIEHGGILRDG